MSRSYVKSYVHIVFSTKYRMPIIKPSYENELYAYMGAICNELECPVIIVGGYKDHVHILCQLSKKLPLMTLVQKVKIASSKWAKLQQDAPIDFTWQRGYGAFSVNPKQLHIVAKYIKNQHKHHSKKTFQDEFREYLDQYEIEYDERYVWI